MRHDGSRGAACLAPWAAACLLVITACGGEAPEQRLEQAAERVRDAREEVREARRDLESEVSEVERKRAEIADARESLEAAQQKLSQATGRLEQRATDVALFRAIQKRLLEAEELRDAAVLASVSDGAVTLYGSVPDAEAQQHALEIVRATPGVTSATSRVQVTNAEQADARSGAPSGASTRGNEDTGS